MCPNVWLILYAFHVCVSTGSTNRPKTQCEQTRDSLQSGAEHGGRPNIGAFIPQCDSEGEYRPLQVGPDFQSCKACDWPITWVRQCINFEPLNDSSQCHGSTGHCWCVDSRGQERPETRTLPGTAPTDCDRPGERIHSLTISQTFMMVTLSLEVGQQRKV